MSNDIIKAIVILQEAVKIGGDWEGNNQGEHKSKVLKVS
jgi:hypothetical protein